MLKTNNFLFLTLYLLEWILEKQIVKLQPVLKYIKNRQRPSLFV